VVASKGRFDRARSVKQRAADGLPSVSTLMAEEFMALSLDVWEIPPESARRVGHPAPFPVELPEQLIRLYTFEGDLVLDPFMGSGSALVAAARLGRRYVGYDTDGGYVDIARRRVAEARAGAEVDDDAELRAAARTEGKAATKLAEVVLAEAGFTIESRGTRVPKAGLAVSFVARDGEGARWLFDVAGPFTSHRDGLMRAEVVWRSLGRVAALRGRGPETPVVLLTTALPRRRSEGDIALRAAGPALVFDVVDLLSDAGRTRLRAYAKGGRTDVPEPGFWTAADVS
jgi:site-specific DNA-methyltransferase (adenine-specific)